MHASPHHYHIVYRQPVRLVFFFLTPKKKYCDYMLKADQIILYSFYINSQKYSDYIETHIKCLHMYPVTKKTPEYYCKSTNCRSVLIFASFEEVIRQRKIVPSKNCNKRLLMSVLDSSNFNMLTFCILYMINVEYFYQVCFVNFLFCTKRILYI